MLRKRRCPFLAAQVLKPSSQVVLPIEPLVGLLRHPTSGHNCTRRDRPEFVDIAHDTPRDQVHLSANLHYQIPIFVSLAQWQGPPEFCGPEWRMPSCATRYHRTHCPQAARRVSGRLLLCWSGSGSRSCSV